MSAKLIVKDHGLAGLFKRAQEAKSAYAKVGVLANGKGGKQHDEESGLTTAEIAAILEYGTGDGRIPPRPALRNTFDAKREELAELGKQQLDQFLDGKTTLPKALNLMGAKLSTETKKTITEGAGVPPPNAPSTIKQKGSDRPWVDTGRVLNSFSWEVKLKGEE